MQTSRYLPNHFFEPPPLESLSLYRKYRSQSFDDLIGQDHVIRTLTSAIERGKISHSYLFTGPRGTGKTSTARLFAKALNCTGGPSPKPPADCPICAEITVGSCMDVIEMDAASDSGVDDVREKIVEFCSYSTAGCRYKIFIIDEVHDLSAKAFDALLKTIEEPPEHVIFILATTEFNKVPPTIRSRCQRFDFHRGTIQHLVERLTYVAKAENVEIEPSALHAIARLADGGYRDALTLLEQAILVEEGKVTLKGVYDQLGLVSDDVSDSLLLAITGNDVPAIIKVTEEIYRQGRDPRSLLESLMYRLSDLTRASYNIEVGTTGDAAVEAGLTATAARLGSAKVILLRSFLADAHKTVRDISLPRLWFEAELVRGATALANPVAAAVSPARLNAPVAKVATRPAAPTLQASSQSQTPTTQPTPATTTPRASTGDPLNDIWLTVVEGLSQISRVASNRLIGSRVTGQEDNQVTIEFEKIVDADWVRESLKVQKAIIEQWKLAKGGDVTFQFIGAGKAVSAPTTQPTSVESPLEGERLQQAVSEVFDVPTSNSEDTIKK